MSAPKIIVQIMVIGGRIFGKALYEAGRQAYKNAQHRPMMAAGGDAAGVQNATSMSLTDKLTREHKMTSDEARLILNVDKNSGIESVMKQFDHLVKANSPKVPAEGAPAAAAGRASQQQQHTSLYLLAKVVRARERLEAEMVVAAEEELLGKGAAEASSKPPPPSSS